MENITVKEISVIFGAILVFIGLMGKVQTKWITAGSDNAMIRTLSLMLGLILVSFVLLREKMPFYSDSTQRVGSASEVSYTVDGTIRKSDDVDPGDIMITRRYPPLNPTYEGKLIGLKVSRGRDGKFPILTFSHPDYLNTAVDLNSESDVIVDEAHQRIIIKETVSVPRYDPPN